MSETISEQIAVLPKLNRAQLRVKWQELLRHPAPQHLRKELLVPLLAYKIQEQAYGGLSASARRRLRDLAQQYGSKSDKKPVRGTVEIKPGTRLLRQWLGDTHHVTVCEKGFEYKGQQYRSLSEIARLITGTRWSGPLFFGLKQHQQKKKAQA